VNRALKFVADIRHGDYPDLPLRKVLAARMLGAKVRIHARIAKLDGTNVSRLFTELQGKAETANPDNHEESLETYLFRIADELRYGHKEPESMKLISAFHENIEKIGCTLCLSSGQIEGGPCKNRPDHDRKVMSAGLYGPQCWSLLAELFISLTELAERHYERYIPAGTLTLRLEPLNTGSNDASAQTYFPCSDAANGRQAIVRVLLPNGGFDERHLKLLPYLLFHEICVHGAESWRGGSRSLIGPLRTSERCAFREGFVDAAAVSVLVEWMYQTSNDLRRNWADLVEHCILPTQASHLHRAIPLATDDRGIKKAKIVQKVQEAREEGIELYHKFVRRFGPKLSAQLAFALNLLELTEDDRIRQGAPQSKWLLNLRRSVARGELQAVEELVRSVLHGNQDSTPDEF
jgi:hypothetical protein